MIWKKLCNDGIADFEGSDLFGAFISDQKKQACTIPYTFVLVRICLRSLFMFQVYDSFLDIPSAVM